MNLTKLSQRGIVYVYTSTKCERLIYSDMMELVDMLNQSDSAEFKKCLPAIRGEYYPEFPYIFGQCNIEKPLWLRYLIQQTDKTDKISCSGFQCWESQLTDVSKLDILDIFNTYRQKVARGTCGARCEANKRRLVFELKWLFYFEFDSMNLLNTHDHCSPSYFNKTKSLIEVNGAFTPIAVYCRTWKVENGTQRELRASLRKLIEENLFDDWDQTQQFSKGLANTVGCKYLLRRNVTDFTTSLNERVLNGNVAHFCCAFGDAILNTEQLQSPFESDTTTENCQKVNNKTEVRSDATYPSLCREILPAGAAPNHETTCQPDASYHDDKLYRFNRLCSADKGFNDSQNMETWNEKPYGLVLRINQTDFFRLECNIPNLPEPPRKENSTALDFNCTHEHEVSLESTSESCEGWSCDDSYLDDTVRPFILNSLHIARHLVAQGQCQGECEWHKKIQYCNVVRLRWHWYLEKKAIEKVRNCPSDYFSNKIAYEDSPFEEVHFFEEVGVVFDIPVKGQDKLPDRFADLFWTNGLKDWTEDGRFRRGNAVWIGCAVVVRPGRKIDGMRKEYKLENGTAVHMVCVYVSFEADFMSLEGSLEKHCCPTCTRVTMSIPCRLKTAKNVSPFPHLCSTIFPMEVAMSCGVKKCPPPLPTTTPSSSPSPTPSSPSTPPPPPSSSTPLLTTSSQSPPISSSQPPTTPSPPSTSPPPPPPPTPPSPSSPPTTISSPSTPPPPPTSSSPPPITPSTSSIPPPIPSSPPNPPSSPPTPSLPPLPTPSSAPPTLPPPPSPSQAPSTLSSSSPTPSPVPPSPSSDLPTSGNSSSGATDIRGVFSRKICKLVIIMYLVVLSILCVLLSLFYKYYIEKEA